MRPEVAAMPRPPAPDPTALSDDELRRSCARRASEGRLERIGSGASSLVSIAAAVGFVMLTRPIVGGFALVLGAGVFVLALGSLVTLTFHLAGARRRPFRAELERRHGWAPHATYLDVERRAFPVDRAPAYTVILSTTALPSGGHRWVRVHLWRTPASQARVEVRAVRWPTGAFRTEDEELIRGEADLPESSRSELLALLESPGPAALAAVPTGGVCDGLPCQVTVLDRATDRVHEGSCNLAGLSDATRDHASVQLANAMLRAGTAIPVPQLMTGWCDPAGNIGIEAL
jgi:hypothetical protein